MKKLISALILIMSSHSFATQMCRITTTYNSDEGLVWHVLLDNISIKQFSGYNNFGYDAFYDVIHYKLQLVDSGYGPCKFGAPSTECFIEIKEPVKDRIGTAFPPFIVRVGEGIIDANDDFLDAFRILKQLIDNELCIQKQ